MSSFITSMLMSDDEETATTDGGGMWIVTQKGNKLVRVKDVSAQKRHVVSDDEVLGTYESADRAYSVFRQIVDAVRAASGTSAPLFELPKE